MSRKIPNLELLGLDTFDRGAVNALGRTFFTHKFPEIFCVKIRGLIKKHNKLLSKFGLESIQEAYSMLGG